jgi:toxin ParE1/3/4
MAEYRLTQAAKSDLQEIWQCSAKHWSAKQAEQYLFSIEIRLDLLAANPALGKHRAEINRNYFSFPAEQHVIFYLKAKNHIDIIGILHARIDVNAQLL